MIELDPVIQQKYSSLVTREYQSSGNILFPTLRVKENITGDTVHFPKIKKSFAYERIPGAPVRNEKVLTEQVSIKLRDFESAQYVDMFKKTKISWDVVSEQAYIVGSALGRCKDQIIIDALTIAENKIDYGTKIADYALIRQITAVLGEKNIRTNDKARNNIHFVVSPHVEQDLLADKDIFSRDFIGRYYRENGSLDGMQYSGLNFHVIGGMDEGGLPLNNGIRTCFLYDGNVVGLGLGVKFDNRLTLLQETNQLQCYGGFSAGSGIIEQSGVYKVLIKESI